MVSSGAWVRAVVAAAVIAGAPPAGAQEGDTARVSDVRGELVVRGTGDSDFAHVERNTVLWLDDTLWTERRARAEVELAGNSWIRLAEDTKLDLVRPGAPTRLRLWTGSVYLDLSAARSPRLLVQTPAGDVSAGADTLFRLDLSDDEQARVTVYRGSARLSGSAGSPIVVQAGERAYVAPDRQAENPFRFDSLDRDRFDEYQQQRTAYWQKRPAPAELGLDLLGGRELHGAGDWVAVDGVLHWRPAVDRTWRPFREGYWVHIPGLGQTWVDYAPWGYVTSHYGRWLWKAAHGWVWRPGAVWAPAQVAWGAFDGAYGWAPLDPGDRPAVVGDDGFQHGAVFVDYLAWTFCDPLWFYYLRHHRHIQRDWRPINPREAGIAPNDFKYAQWARQRIGTPVESVRGLISLNGAEAKDRVLRAERRIPNERMKRIGDRFHVPADRDTRSAGQPSEAASLQRDPQARLEERLVRRGEPAVVVGVTGSGSRGAAPGGGAPTGGTLRRARESSVPADPNKPDYGRGRSTDAAGTTADGNDGKIGTVRNADRGSDALESPGRSVPRDERRGGKGRGTPPQDDARGRAERAPARGNDDKPGTGRDSARGNDGKGSPRSESPRREAPSGREGGGARGGSGSESKSRENRSESKRNDSKPSENRSESKSEDKKPSENGSSGERKGRGK